MTRIPTVLGIALVLGALILVACGGGSDDERGGAVSRTVEIEMRDVAYSPARVDAKAGETVRFVFRNRGEVAHDAFIGDEEAQDEHEAEMRDRDAGDMSGMEHGEMAGEGGLTVQPGGSGEITHTFRGGGEPVIGCHQPGHYAAGMKVVIDVS